MGIIKAKALCIMQGAFLCGDSPPLRRELKKNSCPDLIRLGAKAREKTAAQ